MSSTLQNVGLTEHLPPSRLAEKSNSGELEANNLRSEDEQTLKARILNRIDTHKVIKLNKIASSNFSHNCLVTILISH